jgi:hypothetical protein
LLRSEVLGRLLAIAAISAAIAVVALVLLDPGAPDYVVRARFANASQLVKGNLVQVAGVKIGSIRKIDLTDDGQAEVAMKIDDADGRCGAAPARSSGRRRCRGSPTATSTSSSRPATTRRRSARAA